MIQVERVDFVTIPSTDIARSKRFYGETLGLPHETDWRDVGAEYRAGNVTLALWEPGKMGMEFNASPSAIALRVPDVASARSSLEAAGVEFQQETIDSGVCHMAFFSDPDGNALMLHHRYAPHADASE